jgi:N-acetylglutamate synthase-like GNAT family acetyltransferase
VIDLVDGYLDEAPRPDAGTVAVGAFTLFISRTPWAYYARPALGLDRAIVAADIEILAAACAELGVGLQIEWVGEVRPELEPLARDFGLAVRAHALLVADPRRVVHEDVDGVAIRIAEWDDPGLIAGRAVADVAFGHGGTGVGARGVAERDELCRSLAPELVEHLRYRARSGLSVTALAEDEDGVLATGAYQPIATAAEVVSVATLPHARRRGIAGALIARLASDAAAAGVTTFLLSAQDDDVARVYERVGFTRIAVAFAAHAVDLAGDVSEAEQADPPERSGGR